MLILHLVKITGFSFFINSLHCSRGHLDMVVVKVTLDKTIPKFL